MQIKYCEMTNREIVDKIFNALKYNNKDEAISRRFILKVLRDTTKWLISQKLLDRTLFNEMNLYSEINCFEFEKEDVVKCPIIEFRRCKTLMKSKKPLPELIFSRFGASIKNILSIDGENEFIFVTAEQYRRNQKRQVRRNEYYIYLGADNHLYIPDHEILTVDLTILTLKTDEVVDCSECKDSGCKSNWDYDFIIPDKLIDPLYKDALQTLGLTKQIIEDQNPNNLERQ